MAQAVTFVQHFAPLALNSEKTFAAKPNQLLFGVFITLEPKFP